MKDAKNVLLMASGETRELPDGELSLEQMYEAIGTDIVERVSYQQGAEMWVDEEGLLKANPIPNRRATLLYRSWVKSDEVGIVGNAILSRSKAYLAKAEKQAKKLLEKVA